MNRRGSIRATVFLTAAASVYFFPEELAAVDCSMADTRFGVSSANAFNISSTGFTNAEIQAATGYWGCSGYSGEIPTFQIGGTGGIQVTIVKQSGNSNNEEGSCGLSALVSSNGSITRATITIWTNESDGDTCSPLTDVIAHELGHLLGLTDARDSACLGHIMGSRNINSTRTVQGDDCDVADAKWETPYESQPPTDPYCDAYCWTSCVNSACPSGNPWCPILIDMENDGIHLTGLDDPVWFDIDADGTPNLMSWTDRSEGMLALDRNGNGLIDDGSELFGNATRLADGTRALNGYLALAELDSWVFNGNGDGFIGPADAAFSSLQMWKDRNHDGISQPAELQPLGEAGIRWIGLDYRRSNRTDRYGNEFRFLGKAWKAGPFGIVRPILTWDVFFLTVP